MQAITLPVPNLDEDGNQGWVTYIDPDAGFSTVFGVNSPSQNPEAPEMWSMPPELPVVIRPFGTVFGVQNFPSDNFGALPENADGYF